MFLKLRRFNKKKKELTIRIDREALQTMYGVLVYTRWKGENTCGGNLDEYAEEFYKLWNDALEKGLFDDKNLS